MSRRRLLVLLVVFVATAGGYATLRSEEQCADLGALERFEVGSVVRVDCVPAYVVNTAGDPVVFLARSTHLEHEPITWDPGAKLFRSLHDETFDAEGNSKTGPAPRPLWRCPTEVRHNHLWIRDGGDPKTHCQSSGGVQGRLIAQGGSFPGPPRPTAGEVVVYDEGRVAARSQIGDSGEFRIFLPAGDYGVVATFGNDVSCGRQDVTVSEGKFTSVGFTCFMREPQPGS